MRKGRKEFFDAISSEDKTLKIYDGYFHETLNELGKEAVLDDVMAWINAHI
ncbi:MAG: alpha/beta hydrolase [Deltaproteobacteria bacterium]|nr:alpha/beta hydrolase [Deltaproteobacteria bacterium]